MTSDEKWDTPTLGSILTTKGGSSTPVNESIAKYTKYFDNDGNSLKKEESAEICSRYYELVTDFYEYGWGQSFHFAPMRKGDGLASAQLHHHYLIALKLKLEKGMKVLDVGCGVGGPLRNIAAFSGAHVTGLNISKYQIERARHLTQKAEMNDLCTFVEGDFNNMPFPDNSFDAIYSIEAICHSRDRVKTFTEIKRVLKPGGLFLSQDWIVTDHYSPDDSSHKQIIAGILEGDALTRLDTASHVESCLIKSGLHPLEVADYRSKSQLQWSHPLQAESGKFRASKLGRLCTHGLLYVMEKIRLAPKGSVDVHNMLCKGADNLVKSNQIDIFSPLFVTVARK
ncbi:uncharacterized protein [Oscarella lobularis]|uniref:uncharacterized protein n=1 Tax=Oscarella lobularis TaxID=121494 RepID=UPI0033135426